MKRKIFLSAMACVLALGCGATAYAAPETMADGTVFDAEYYAETYPDLKAAFGNDKTALYNHYVQHGKAEGRKPCADGAGAAFDAAYYAAQNPDVVAVVGTDADALYQHYVSFGKAEGRKGSAGDRSVVNTADTTVTAQQTAKKYTCVIEPGDEQYWDEATWKYSNFTREDYTDNPLYIYLRDQLEAGINGTGGERQEGVIWAPAYEGIIGDGVYVIATWEGKKGEAPSSNLLDNLMVDMMKAYPNGVDDSSYYQWITHGWGGLASEEEYFRDSSNAITTLKVTFCMKK